MGAALVEESVGGDFGHSHHGGVQHGKAVDFKVNLVVHLVTSLFS